MWKPRRSILNELFGGFSSELFLLNSMDGDSELPHPTALGATRPSLVEGGASCFCVGPCTRRGHSGSRLRRRFPLTGGSECPTPTDWTLGHNRRRTLFVVVRESEALS